MVPIPESKKRAIQGRLKAWYKSHRRPLPWRSTRDPYAIWISEVMLQQTQVATVVPYFLRFLKVFPNVRRLARASEQRVLHQWEGLGYYRRARCLHHSARILWREHGGRIPPDAAVLEALPGFGKYTVGAVLSQAFDCPLPVVEANSRRVLSRLFGVGGTSSSVERRLWRIAEELLPERHVGDFNQALMELGALVCLPRPRCKECPLHSLCMARRQNLQERIPCRSKGPRSRSVHEIGVVVHRRRRVLVVQRPVSGRWAGLWEFPHGPMLPGETKEHAARRLLAELTGIRAEIAGNLLSVRHGIMHYRVTLDCLEAVYTAGRFESSHYACGRWLRPRDLQQLPVSSPQRRLAQALLRQEACGEGIQN